MTKLISSNCSKSFWDGKWLIAGLSALVIAPAFAFLAFIYEPGKKASINLLPLSGVQMNLL
jgi:LPS O-antigen subunit length determinant protein (WzzB/FepE family)